MIRRARFEIFEIVQFLLKSLPGTFGAKIRSIVYPLFLKKSGYPLVIGQSCKFQCPENISIGYNSGFNDYCWVASNPHLNASIDIGNHVLVGPYVIMHSGNHNFDNLQIPIKEQGFTFKPIVVEDNVWIGARSIILSGVTLRKGSIIAAGSVVTKSTEEYGIYGGVPATFIKSRIL